MESKTVQDLTIAAGAISAPWIVNATAWISHREDHHPDITVGYNKCEVAYMTHAIKGISENDFICAAKLDALFDL